MGTPTGASTPDPKAERPKMLTTDRAAAVLVFAAVAWLALSRKAFGPSAG